MERIYETYGEFEVPRKDVKKGKALDFSKDALSEFWSKVEEKHPGLPDAVGCYIFATKAGPGITPWYVGQTKGSFKGECFQPSKQTTYHDVCNGIKGTPVLILVARCTPKGKLVKGKLKISEADFVEQLLIRKALSKNGKLANIKNTSFTKEIILPGVLNNPKGKPGPGSKLLSRVLGTK